MSGVGNSFVRVTYPLFTDLWKIPSRHHGALPSRHLAIHGDGPFSPSVATGTLVHPWTAL